MSTNSNNTKSNEWKEREVGALWKRTGPKGSYCTGYMISDELGNKVKQRVIMFSNKNKLNDKSPDFVIYLSNENPDASQNKSADAPKKKTSPVTKQAVANMQPDSEQNDDDIPM